MIKTVRRVNIDNKRITLNESTMFQFQETQNTAYSLKEAYRYLKIDYFKFFKMDNLSKLGFLSAEILLEGIDNKEDFCVILSTSSSSLDTDTAFQETIQNVDNFFPSPMVFVYTLPNIVIGEICIRHKIHGENMMCIINENNVSDFYHKTQFLIHEMNVRKGITGYLDCYQNDFKSEFILFETN